MVNKHRPLCRPTTCPPICSAQVPADRFRRGGLAKQHDGGCRRNPVRCGRRTTASSSRWPRLPLLLHPSNHVQRLRGRHGPGGRGHCLSARPGLFGTPDGLVLRHRRRRRGVRVPAVLRRPAGRGLGQSQWAPLRFHRAVSVDVPPDHRATFTNPGTCGTSAWRLPRTWPTAASAPWSSIRRARRRQSTLTDCPDTSPELTRLSSGFTPLL